LAFRKRLSIPLNSATASPQAASGVDLIIGMDILVDAGNVGRCCLDSAASVHVYGMDVVLMVRWQYQAIA